MLFDLRGRGRRNTVRIIYMGLALIFGAGFIGLGVGVGAGGGGLLNAFTESEGSGGTTFAKEIKKYRKLTQEHPNSTSPWEQLLKVEVHEAGNEAYVSHGQPTAKGKELLHQTAQDWNRYLAIAGENPNPEVAQLMVNVFSAEGLDEPAAEVQVLQIVVAARPTVHFYSYLAAYAYQAHNPSVGDLAAAKAVSLAPAVSRPRLRTELAAIRKNPTGTTEEAASSKTGQKFTVKRSANGSITAVPGTTTTTTTTPAGQAPSKK